MHLAIPGISTYDTELTIPEAITARSKGIVIYSIGITSSINEQELRYERKQNIDIYSIYSLICYLVTRKVSKYPDFLQ